MKTSLPVSTYASTLWIKYAHSQLSALFPTGTSLAYSYECSDADGMGLERGSETVELQYYLPSFPNNTNYFKTKRIYCDTKAAYSYENSKTVAKPSEIFFSLLLKPILRTNHVTSKYLIRPKDEHLMQILNINTHTLHSQLSVSSINTYMLQKIYNLIVKKQTEFIQICSSFMC